MKNTPGPWGIEQTTNRGYVGPLSADGKLKHVVTYIGTGEQLSPESLAERQANLQLLAAAPDMLSLVVRCYRALHRDEWEDGETESELTERINDIMHNNFGEAWQQLVDQTSEA